MTLDIRLKGGWPVNNRDRNEQPVSTPISWGWGSNRRGQPVVTLNYDGGSLLMKPDIAAGPAAKEDLPAPKVAYLN